MRLRQQHVQYHPNVIIYVGVFKQSHVQRKHLRKAGTRNVASRLKRTLRFLLARKPITPGSRIGSMQVAAGTIFSFAGRPGFYPFVIVSSMLSRTFGHHRPRRQFRRVGALWYGAAVLRHRQRRRTSLPVFRQRCGVQFYQYGRVTTVVGVRAVQSRKP